MFCLYYVIKQIKKALKYISEYPNEAYVMILSQDKRNRAVKTKHRYVMCSIANALIDYDHSKLPTKKLYINYQVVVDKQNITSEIKPSASVNDATKSFSSALAFMNDASDISFIIATTESDREYTIETRWVENSIKNSNYDNNKVLIDIQKFLLSQNNKTKLLVDNKQQKISNKESKKDNTDKKIALSKKTKQHISDLTFIELRKITSERKIKGRSKMNKAALIDALTH